MHNFVYKACRNGVVYLGKTLGQVQILCATHFASRSAVCTTPGSYPDFIQVVTTNLPTGFFDSLPVLSSYFSPLSTAPITKRQLI